MAVALDSSNAGATGNGATLNQNLTNAAGTLLTCGIGWQQNASGISVSSASFNSVALSQLAGSKNEQTAGFGIWMGVDRWYKLNPTADGLAHTLSVTFSTSVVGYAGGATWTGHDTTNPFSSIVGVVTGGAANTTATTNSRTIGAGSVLLGGVTALGTALTEGNTKLWQVHATGTDDLCSGEEYRTSTGACTWTGVTDFGGINWVTNFAEIQVPQGGAAVSIDSPRPHPLLIGLTRNALKARPWTLPSFQPSPQPLIPAVAPTMSPLMARFERRFGRQPFVRPMPAGVSRNAYVFSADPGSYTLTGSAATLLAARLVNASAGTYTITGRAASLLKGYVVQATAGSYALTGAAATLLAARLLSIGSGSYVITGRTASLLKGYAVPALRGAYTLNGIDATLTASSAPTAYLLSADPGSYTLSGSAATLAVTTSGQANTGGRLPRKIRAGKKRHPDDILREQREEQRYLDELEAKAKAAPAPEGEHEPEVAEPTVPALRDAAARAIPPVLSDEAARAASGMQEMLQRAEEAAAAELQKKKRRQALVLLLAHD